MTRICNNFKPEEHLIKVNYSDGSPDELYLEVKFRVEWFNTWCEEHNVVGIIDESQYQIHPELNLVVVTCKVFTEDRANGCPAKLEAAASAGASVFPGDVTELTKAVQTAATSAKGRALADAGFSTAMATARIPSESGEPIPVDSGIRFVRDAGNPLLFTRVNENETHADTNGNAQPAAPATDAKAGMTLQDARLVVVPIGKYKGKKLFEVMAEDANTVKWYASDSFDKNNRYTAFKEAATMVAQAAQA